MNSKTLYLAGSALVILTVTALIYWSGLNGPFLLDDRPNILIPYIEQTGWDTFYYAVTHNDSGMLGRSVSLISLVLSGMIYGIEPWGYKFHNLLIHLVVGVLLCRFVWRLLPVLTGKPADNQTVLIAGLLASLWLVHPLFVSTVLYAVQRMTQLSALFTLLSLLIYLEARLSLVWGNKERVFAWILFPLSLGLAMLSKESGALIPVFVLAIELLAFRTTFATLKARPPLALFLGVFVAIPLLVGALYIVTHLEVVANYNHRTFTLPERLMTELHVVFFYARLILLPRLSSMSLYHDDFPVTSAMDAGTAILLLVLIGVLALIWFGRHKVPVLSFGLAWFLISHLLESTFIPLELVFEHRNYLAAAGLLLPLVYSLFHLPGVSRLPLILVLVIPGFAVMTWSRAGEWQTERMMLTVGVTEHPDSPRMRIENASYLLDSGNLEGGIAELAIVAQLRPTDAGPLIHQLVVKCTLGESDPALLAQAQERLARYPANTYAMNALGLMLDVIMKETCNTLMIDDFGMLVAAGLSLQENLNASETHGYLLRFSGLYNFQRGYYAQAVIDFRQAHEVSGFLSMLVELVTFQSQIGRFADARDTLDLIRQYNTENFGTEVFQIRRLEQMILDDEQAFANQQVPAVDSI